MEPDGSCSRNPLTHTFGIWMHSIPSHLISSRTILILSYLRLGGLCRLGFPTKMLYSFLIFRDKLMDSRSVRQISCFLWNPKIRCTVHEPPLRHWTLFWASWIQSTPSHPIFWRCSLILSFLQHLMFSSGAFPWGFQTEISHPNNNNNFYNNNNNT
jgi:hypothetical protein